MKQNINKILEYTFSMKRYLRRSLFILFDTFSLALSLLLCFWIGSDNAYLTSKVYLWLFPSLIIIGIPLFIITGQYKGITRYLSNLTIYNIALRNLILINIILVVGFIFEFRIPPFRIFILFWILITLFAGFTRLLFRDFVLQFMKKNKVKMRVAIYGAGAAGSQLAAAIRLTGEYRIICFFDDSPSLWNRELDRIPIFSASKLGDFTNKFDQVLLAIPSLSPLRRKEIIFDLKNKGTSLLEVPSIDDLILGRKSIDKLSSIDIEDLLGRDIANHSSGSIKSEIQGSVVCVTGAGGSIGGQLCREIIKSSPSKIILLEQNEPSLYLIHQELSCLENEDSILEPVLGSARDQIFLNKIFVKYSVDIVFHTAAYKHVPLVEHNPLAGISNNVLSTLAICEASENSHVKKVILISTDKAVRPSNVMGASKRLAELVVQAYAKKSENLNGENKIVFAMVRFGNVLDSSGSVVPLFKKQISEGGPITLTHPKIIRYFMTIPEAVLLVLQSSLLAKGGEVFLLNMGEPVLIKNLAENMVRLSGLTVKDDSNPKGDIELIYTGLRPGEKLYEELLIDATSKPTTNPFIFRANEKSLSNEELFPKLSLLKNKLLEQDVPGSLSLLKELVPEWTNKTSTTSIYRKSHI